MGMQTFFDNLDVVVSAPDGIDQVRSMVLALGLRGQLVTQDDRDESSQRLIEKIRDEHLVSPARGLDETKELIHPWSIPPSWSWVRFGSLVEYKPGKTPPTKDPAMWGEPNVEGAPWATIADLDDGGTLTTTHRWISQAAVESVMKGGPVSVGTLLMSFKLTLGKVCRLGIPAFHNEAIISINAPFRELDEYLFRFLPVLVSGGSSKAVIMGQTLNATSLANMPIPVPPLEEQARIVAKVDELMARCEVVRESLKVQREIERRLSVAATRLD